MTKKKSIVQRTLKRITDLINEVVQTLTTQFFTSHYLSQNYIITLGIISLLALGGHLFIHHVLYQQSRDNYVIKIARQQLILSETLSKTALVIQSTNDYKKNVEYTSLFRSKLNLWRNFHEGLQKRHEKLGLSGQNSIQVINMFADLQPIYWKMDTFATKLVNTLEEDLFHSAFYADFAIDVSQLIEIEGAFMQQMEAIVRQYETEASSHVNHLKKINFIWVTLTLMVLLIQGLYVFHPAFQVVEQLNQKLTDFKHTTEEKEAWLQGMLDNTPALIYLKDYQGRYKFTNRQFEILSRAKPENMKGKNDYDFFEPQVAAILQANDFKVLESKTPCQLEETILQEDGLHTYHSIRFPLINATKGAYAVVGLYLDLTECRKIKNTLQESQAMLQALLGAIPEMALFIDTQGFIIHANTTAMRKLGLPKEGGHLDDFFPTARLEKRKLYLHEVFRTGLPIRFEDVTHGKYLDNFVYPTVLAKETTSAAMVCVDITKTRLTAHTKEIPEGISSPSYPIESWLWEKVLNSLYEGIIIADATQDRPVIYVNPAFEHLTGYQASEILGKNCRFLHNGDNQQSALTEVRNALQNGKNCNVVLRNYRKDGTSFWNRLCISPLYDETGKLTHFVGIQINITTQKQAEEALRVSEERYRRIVNTAQEGIWIADEHAIISFANQRLANMLEDSLDKIIDHSLFEFMDETTLINMKPLFEQTSPWRQEPKDICFHRRTGSRLWTLVNMSPLFDENNKLIGILGMVADITERKQAEEALLASENKFRSLTESVAAIILICQEDKIIYANSSTTLLTGYPPSELLHKDLKELIHPSDIISQNPASSCEDNPFPHYEVSLLTKQQETRWLEVTVRSIEFQGDLATLITAFDITERKQTQETLRNVVEGVSSTTGENFLRSLMEYLAQCLQIKYALVGQLLPSKPTKIITLAVISDHQLIDNFEYELQNTPCEELLKGKRATCCSCSHGLKDLFPTNRHLVEEKIESCVGTPLLDAKGTLLGVMIIMDTKPLNHLKLVESMLQIFAARASGELQRIQMLEDLKKERASLTERVLERTAELTNANAELARAARLKNEFLANMSHELRTPLNTIITLSEALQDQIYGELNLPQNDSIHAIEDSGRHLLGLINDILELAKIEAGKVKLQVLPVSVEGISKACMRIVKAWTEKKHIKMTLTIDQLVTNVQADDRYLRQILTNLLSNAIKFTPEEGQVNLDIKGNKDQGVVYLSVSDTGKGIAQEDMLHLFKPFEQLDGRLAKEHEGTGLGLCLIYRLTEMHGGSVIVESGIGQGSRFTICLPWQSEEFPFSPLPHQEGVVLLAEDNPNILARLFDYLSINGYQVIVARNGIQVVEQAIEFKPDIILMDLQMPVMDGLKAIRQIRAHPDIETIPIIALTALIVPGEKDRCLEAGANEYLSKPVSFKELNRALTSLLEHHPLASKSSS